ncbi:MAG: orotidine-5'-phosphate decarboxylase [Solirubrobacteraceae bacterium]
MSGEGTAGFGDLLARRVEQRQSQIVLGLDPHPAQLWPSAGNPQANASAQHAATAVLDHCRALIDAAGPACVAVKPQLACFERLGAAGWAALEGVVAYAREQGLLVIADGKRGDVPVSATAYAQALLGCVEGPAGVIEGLRVDVVTVNPLMGRDSLEPFVATARAGGSGLFVLVRTSNPGASDIQDLELAGGGRVWQRLAALVKELGEPGVGLSGLSDIGAVVGATVPAHLELARELMPHAVFLMPGVGAQGADVQSLAAAFAPGRAGGLVTASRSIAGAYLEAGGDPHQAARVEAERLRATAWALV